MDIDAVLLACLSIDNQVRQPAEEAVKSLSSKPEVVAEFLKRLSAPDSRVRHLAAVLVRKPVSRHWNKLDAQTRKTAQTVLLQSLAHEPDHMVRRAAADVTAAVAKLTVPKGQWPDLLSTLQQWSQGTSAEHREVALTLFSSLAEIIGELMASAVPTLIGFVSNGLREQHNGVRSAALRAVESLVPLVSSTEHVQAFHPLVACLIEATASAVRRGQEDESVRCFQLVGDVCEAPAPLVGPHLASVVRLVCETASATQVSPEVRDQALEVLTVLAEHKPKQLSKRKELIAEMVTCLCNMARVPDTQDPDVKSSRAAAGQTLDTLCLTLPAQHICPQVLTFAREAQQSASVEDRCAAQTVVAVLCEGCATWLRKHIEELLQLVMAGLQDGNGHVRAAAAFAVGQMSEFMAHEVVEHHATILPALLAVMAGESDPSLQERACYAVDTFCEALEPEEIAPYMSQVMEQLVAVLTRGAHVSHAGIQEVALSAIAATATASGPDFLRHLPTVLPPLSHFMGATSQEMVQCRCKATEVMGALFEHLGPLPESGLSQLLPGVMEAAMAGWGLGSSEIREYTHCLWASAAKGFGAAFAPYLATVVPLAYESLNQDEGQLAYEGDSDGSGDEAEEDKAGTAAQEEDLGSDDTSEGEGSDQEGEAGARQIHVHSGLLDEKCSALQALGMYAEHTGQHYLPYLEESMKRAVHLAEAAWHEELQIQACEALPRFVTCTAACFPPPTPTPTQPTTHHPPTPSPQVQQALSVCCPPLVASLSSPDVSVVCAAMGAWQTLLKGCGAVVLGQWLPAVSDMVAQALADKAPCCQYIQTDAEEDEEEGDGSHTEELVSAAADLLPVMAQAAGADAYAPVLASSHLPGLLKRMGNSQTEDVRGVAVGAVAELAERMQGHMAPHLPKLVPPLLRELKAQDPVNRQNAAFAVGVLAEGCGAQAMSPYLPQLLQALQALFAKSEAPGVKDNAVGCLARFVLCAPPESSVVPLEAVVPAMCGVLPPSEDWSEAAPSYRALCQIITAGDQTLSRVAAHVPLIVRTLAAALVEPKLPDATHKLIRETVKALRVKHAAHLDPILAALPPQQQAALVSETR